MKNKKLVTIVAVASLALFGVVGTTLAYFTDSKEASNVITMGNVGINLTEPIFSENNENNTITNVTPNQTIQKDPLISVKNDSNDCYIRASLNIVGLTNSQTAELEKAININEGWTKSSDGYYYYNSKLTKGSEVYLFETFTVPENWGSEIANKEFKINVKAEAIQADNFTPSMSNGAITGWADSNNVPIEL